MHFNNLQVFNETHSTVKHYPHYVQTTWQLIPELSFLYPFKETEGSFSGIESSNWMHGKDYIPIGTSIAYVILIFYIQKWMQKRKPFHLVGPLYYWNLLLSIFSTVGFIRTAPHLYGYYMKQNQSFYITTCKSGMENAMNSEVGLWSMLFVFSKFPELIDTIFIVLRKKPLIFLHWYHHIISQC